MNRPNVVGLELINEPASNPSLWSWYQSTFAALRSISPDMPLYIGDAWDPNTYTAKAGERNDHIVRTSYSHSSPSSHFLAQRSSIPTSTVALPPKTTVSLVISTRTNSEAEQSTGSATSPLNATETSSSASSVPHSTLTRTRLVATTARRTASAACFCALNWICSRSAVLGGSFGRIRSKRGGMPDGICGMRGWRILFPPLLGRDHMTDLCLVRRRGRAQKMAHWVRFSALCEAK